MTQASNLANFANNLNSSGQVDPNALSAPTPIAKGGTGSSNATDARTALNVPSRTGNGASGTWDISVTGSASFATNSTTSVTSSRVVSSNWIIEESGNVLQFKDSSGNLKMTMSLTNGLTVY
jgi:hypothetical protein